MSPPAPDARPAVILLGPRGSGKTTVARGLSELLALPWIDLDREVESAAGRTIAELFASEGETGFRDRESAALRDALGKRAIVATGGGVIVRETNRLLLKQLPSPRVLLLAAPQVLHARVAADPATAASRPALTALAGADEIRHLLAQRLPLYREVATHELDVGALNPETVAQRILALIR